MVDEKLEPGYRGELKQVQGHVPKYHMFLHNGQFRISQIVLDHFDQTRSKLPIIMKMATRTFLVYYSTPNNIVVDTSHNPR